MLKKPQDENSEAQRKCLGGDGKSLWHSSSFLSDEDSDSNEDGGSATGVLHLKLPHQKWSEFL